MTKFKPANIRLSHRRWLSFLAIWSLLAAFWFGLLPGIAAQPDVAARLAELESQGIDPSAMYYSELPVMDDVLIEVDALHRRHPDALWKPGSSSRHQTEPTRNN